MEYICLFFKRTGLVPIGLRTVALDGNGLIRQVSFPEEKQTGAGSSMNPYTENIERIEFVVTMACTGRCKHCSEGDHTGIAGHIDAQAAVLAVRDLCGAYHIRSLMTFGGEPLLYPDAVCAIHRAATDLGIERRQLITNGFFSKDPRKIEETALRLAESGVNDLLLSVDAFHQETIPLEPVLCFAKCAAQAGIPLRLSPAWLVSREDGNPYNVRTREVLAEFTALGIPEGSGNVIFPSGNALKYLAEYFGENPDLSTPYDDDPLDVRTVSFSPDGSVDGMNGNIYQTGILEIIGRYKPET